MTAGREAGRGNEASGRAKGSTRGMMCMCVWCRWVGNGGARMGPGGGTARRQRTKRAVEPAGVRLAGGRRSPGAQRGVRTGRALQKVSARTSGEGARSACVRAPPNPLPPTHQHPNPPSPAPAHLLARGRHKVQAAVVLRQLAVVSLRLHVVDQALILQGGD